MTREEKINEAWCKYMGKFSTEIMQALAFALRWCDEHPHWISVEEIHPPCREDVLLWSSDSDKALTGFRSIDAIYYVYDDDEFSYNITHWMPMPQPPHHIIDANKKVDRVIGTADHIKTALDVLNKKGGLE